MRNGHSSIIFFGVVICFLSSVFGSYDPGYGVHADNTYEASYATPPVVHGQHGHGQSAGSYYHYHVPLVGQQQYHHQPYHQQQSGHDLHYLLPLLLLAALPLLLLPLLPLLLLPLGLSILALIMPGGMMMMMMMMMMMPMMSPPGVRDGIAGRAATEMRSLGELVLNDVSSLATKYARSLDLDKCPERVACELGLVLFPANSSQSLTAKTFMNYIVEQAVPKGKTRKMFRSYRDAFWIGSSSSNCTAYQCQPTFRIFQDSVHAKYFPQDQPQHQYGQPIYENIDVKAQSAYPQEIYANVDTKSSQPQYVQTIYSTPDTSHSNNTIYDSNTSKADTNANNANANTHHPSAKDNKDIYANYYTQYQHQLGNTNYTYTKADEKIAKAYYDYYADLVPASTSPVKEGKLSKSKTKIKVYAKKFYNTFGTPTVKS